MNLGTAAPEAEDRVLPTLNPDGSRRFLHPKLAHGRFLRARRAVAAGLILLFVALPFVRFGDKPAVLLDLPRRQFTFFGTTFLPTDSIVLLFLGLSIALAVLVLTALFGRVWCGWACPQTVYLEMVFRPIERLFEGGPAQQRAIDKVGLWHPRRLAKNGAFAVLAVIVGNVFLSYFVGVESLVRWVTRSPLEHPGGFLVMAAVSALMLFDFGWFREQTCMVACPYGRLQSVLLDRKSLIVGYDARRGEPRGKAHLKVVAPAAAPTGDCVDCKACVVTCPTGIDIREGLQMECIGCTQCIDACDAIMDKLDRPRGLIRYTSQDELAGLPRRVLRPRLMVYPALLLAALGGFAFTLARHTTAHVTVLRGGDTPFTLLADGSVSSQVQVKVENRGATPRAYRFDFPAAADARMTVALDPLNVPPGGAAVEPLFIFTPRAGFVGGERRITLRVRDDGGFETTLPLRLIGPEGAP